MYAMQYKINLPADYDMQIIRDRVRQNGHFTDGFADLLFKAYLISEQAEGAVANSYAPLYIWKDSAGMNKFIFDGYFDNIIRSFGWHPIQIGVTQLIDLDENFSESAYVTETYHTIEAQTSLQHFDFAVSSRGKDELGKVVIYNPDKWQYVVFTFWRQKPAEISNLNTLYQILHLSLEK